MTREELRDYVEKQRNLNNIPYHVYSVLIDGIDTLEQEPTTKNDLGVDYISREQALKELKESAKHHANDSREEVLLRRDRDIIRTLPSVTPIRPKGHWIETAEDYYKAINEKGGGVNDDTPLFWDDIACSECLTKFSVIDNDTERFDFCPSCGSDNREVEE